MYKLDYSCCLYGNKFDPTPFLKLTDISVISCNHVGDIGKRGRYKEKSLPYASINFTSLDDNFDGFIQKLHEIKNLFMECDIEEKKIDIALYYTGQGNMEFTAETLFLIGDLGLDLTISCYKENEKDINGPDSFFSKSVRPKVGDAN